MIRFIVETFSSVRDVNGNRRHHATITSTKTGKQLLLKDAGGKIITFNLLFGKLGAMSRDHVYTTECTRIPLIEFKHMPHNRRGMYEHDLTAEMLIDLEKVQ